MPLTLQNINRRRIILFRVLKLSTTLIFCPFFILPSAILLSFILIPFLLFCVVPCVFVFKSASFFYRIVYLYPTSPQGIRLIKFIAKILLGNCSSNKWNNKVLKDDDHEFMRINTQISIDLDSRELPSLSVSESDEDEEERQRFCMHEDRSWQIQALRKSQKESVILFISFSSFFGTYYINNYVHMCVIPYFLVTFRVKSTYVIAK